MLFGVKSYLNFLWKSSNQYGVHSPFVFKLVTKCFYDSKKYSEYATLDRYKSELLKNNQTIQITDFGAGSRIFKSDVRKIADIAKTSAISKRRAKALYRIVKYFEPKRILEIGTSLGIATAAMALARKDAKITTVEGCAQTSAAAQLQFEHFNLKNVTSIRNEFGDYFKQLTTEKFDLIYFDGNHTEEATLAYFNALLPTITNDTCWIFDDIYWSLEMQSAWHKIKNHELVTVTIDTFQWGFVFFRTEQQKEHFIIRL